MSRKQKVNYRGVELVIEGKKVTLGDSGIEIGQMDYTHRPPWTPRISMPGTPGTKSASAATLFDDFLLRVISDGDPDRIAQNIGDNYENPQTPGEQQ